VEPVRVPQHLELEDVIAWGLGATDLMCVAAGAVSAWWLYLNLPLGFDLRVAAAAPLVLAGLAFGTLRFGELALRDWLRIALRYASRPRTLICGDGL
jgi:hypothetical protein